MPIKVCIIEDEEDAQNVLLSHINKTPANFELLKTANSFESGADLLENYVPDLLLLDINLAGKSGLDLAKNVDLSKTKIVFTTAYDKHVLEALRLNAFDYLLKPIFYSDFNEMIERFMAVHKPKKNNSLDEVIIIVNNDGQHVLKYSEIECLEAAGAYCIFYLQSKEKIIVSKPLKHYATILENSDIFCRCHKSFLINEEYIVKLKFGENSLELKSGKVVTISRNQKLKMKSRFEIG